MSIQELEKKVDSLTYNEKLELMEYIRESLLDKEYEEDIIREHDEAIKELKAGKKKLESPNEMFDRLGL